MKKCYDCSSTDLDVKSDQFCTKHLNEYVIRECDICDKKLTINNQYYSHSNLDYSKCDKKLTINNQDYSFDICTDCFNFKEIDRLNYSIEEKPRCIYCDTLLGGSHKWYNNKNIDICQKCYKENNILKIFKYKNFQDYKKVYILNRSCFPDIINIEIPKKLLSLKEINNFDFLENEENEETIDYEENINISDVVFCYINNSSFYDLIPLTKFKDCIDYSSSLLINANPESKDFKKIAIVISDDNGNILIKYIYDNIQKFKEEYIKWKYLDKNFKETLYDGHINNTELIDSFSIYFVHNTGLSYYYG